jgi:flagellar biosynthesis protein FlhG
MVNRRAERGDPTAPQQAEPSRGRVRLMPHQGQPSELDRVNHPAQWRRPRVPMIAVASGKGGVGKSNLAANLAVALGEQGVRVLLVDADLAQANLDLLLGLHPRFDIQHVLSGEKTPEEIIVRGPHDVRLVPASSGVPGLADLDDYRRECLLRALSQVEQDADVVLMDMASGASQNVSSLCLACDEIVIVTTPELPAFSDAYAFIKQLQQLGRTRPPHLVVNMASVAEEAEETAHRIRLVARRFLQLEVGFLGFVPFDPAVVRAVRRQEPVVTAFPQSPAAVAYRGLAARVWEAPEPDPTLRAPAPEQLEA